MRVTPSKINIFLFFKLPSAFFCGVRVREISENHCGVTVRDRWINQNPFKSMYFAVQAMAGELSTGALVMSHIKRAGKEVSMLVISNRSSFYKKAQGKITFKCCDGQLIDAAIKDAIATGQGQTFWMKSIGTNQNGEQVCEMEFEWSVRSKYS